MKSVLISIQPKWCELIASGKKTVEVRKTKPKLETPFKVYIYCTANKNGTKDLLEIHGTDGKIRKANGKVIGEFVCDKVVDFENSMYEPAFHETSVLSCVEYEKLALYLGKKDFGYGWHISNLVIYDEPRELSEFSSGSSRLEFSNTEDGFPLKWSGMKRPPQSWCYVESEGGK